MVNATNQLDPNPSVIRPDPEPQLLTEDGEDQEECEEGGLQEQGQDCERYKPAGSGSESTTLVSILGYLRPGRM